jgi:beta-lactamase superfamily II metal-dependent hydrolase
MKAAIKSKAARKSPTGKPNKNADGQPDTASAPNAASGPSTPGQPRPTGKIGLRVRMFRVGFGDFFLLSIPTAGGPSHILIDCGVHARDLGSIREAVTQMAQDCNNKLALVIMTHRHADHISGFGSCADIFSKIEIERVWMPWFENPSNEKAARFQSSLTALADHLGSGFRARLAAGADPVAEQMLSMAENITGGMSATGGSANAKALQVLQSGFKNPAPHDYYQAGDAAKLPQELVDAGFTAQILGPPIDESLVAQMTNKTQQYLSGATEENQDGDKAPPFAPPFRARYDDYSARAFEIYGADQIVRMIDESQPDMLAAQAVAADKTLNNQSLVILFSFAGKNLLFAGDAQWGNWENFLYGGAYGTPGHTTMTDAAKAILDKIDFYKVGHHGSANATPKDAVKAMRMGCVGMCSTQEHAYNQVPREPLLTALRQRMADQLARSDQVGISNDNPANPDAGGLPSAFVAPTHRLFIDYNI